MLPGQSCDLCKYIGPVPGDTLQITTLLEVLMLILIFPFLFACVCVCMRERCMYMYTYVLYVWIHMYVGLHTCEGLVLMPRVLLNGFSTLLG